MSEIFGLLMTFLPLFAIVWMANLAEARRERGEGYNGLAIVTYVFVALMYGAAVTAGLFVHLFTFLASQETTDPSLLEPLANFEADSMLLLGVGLWLPSLIGLALLPPVRRLIARYIPIDADSPVHTIALALSMLAIINLLVTLGFGLGNFADVLAENQDAGGNTIAVLWLQQILTALLAMIGVGWLTRRSWGPTLERLALVIPTGRQWLIGLGLGLGMALVVFFLIQPLANMLGVTADADVERLTEQLLGSLFTTPLGILTLGLAAGLGEETLFRGAVLPRFGLILTSVFFALIHSHYGITFSTLVVFALGLILGWLRLRYNTSTAMITHAVYNMTLGLITYLFATMLDM